MKKSILIGIIAMTAGLASSYGAQGFLQFDTYDANNYLVERVLWGPNGVGIDVGTPVGIGFTAGLVYSTTPITESAQSIGGPLSPGWTLALNTASFRPFNFPAIDGWFAGNTFTLVNYTPGSQVYLEVLAYNGSSYDTSTIRAHSASFSEILTTGISVPNDIEHMPAFTVSALPEPSTVALAGLGMAALMSWRRRR